MVNEKLIHLAPCEETFAELQELGAWKSELMVKRYAHFAPEQLRAAAARLATFSSTPAPLATLELSATS